jgi:hypothetical protein
LRRLFGFYFILLAVLPGGCLIINRYPSEGKPIVLQEGMVLVFGRVQVFENGIDVTRDYCDPWVFNSSSERLLDFLLLDLERRRVALHIIPENDGAFYWVLPRGFYKISLIRYREEFDPNLAFRIPEGDQYVYIGKLVIRAEMQLAPHGSLRKSHVDIRRDITFLETKVEDDYEHDRLVLVGRFRDLSGAIGKSLVFTNYQK